MVLKSRLTKTLEHPVGTPRGLTCTTALGNGYHPVYFFILQITNFLSSPSPPCTHAPLAPQAAKRESVCIWLRCCEQLIWPMQFNLCLPLLSPPSSLLSIPCSSFSVAISKWINFLSASGATSENVQRLTNGCFGQTCICVVLSGQGVVWSRRKIYKKKPSLISKTFKSCVETLRTRGPNGGQMVVRQGWKKRITQLSKKCSSKGKLYRQCSVIDLCATKIALILLHSQLF